MDMTGKGKLLKIYVGETEKWFFELLKESLDSL